MYFPCAILCVCFVQSRHRSRSLTITVFFSHDGAPRFTMLACRSIASITFTLQFQRRMQSVAIDEEVGLASMVHDLMEVQSHYLHTPLEDTCTCAHAWCKNTCQMHEMFHGRGNMLMSFRLGLHLERDAWDPRCETQCVATSWRRHTLGSAFFAKWSDGSLAIASAALHCIAIHDSGICFA